MSAPIKGWTCPWVRTKLPWHRLLMFFLPLLLPSQVVVKGLRGLQTLKEEEEKAATQIQATFRQKKAKQAGTWNWCESVEVGKASSKTGRFVLLHASGWGLCSCFSTALFCRGSGKEAAREGGRKCGSSQNPSTISWKESWEGLWKWCYVGVSWCHHFSPSHFHRWGWSPGGARDEGAERCCNCHTGTLPTKSGTKRSECSAQRKAGASNLWKEIGKRKWFLLNLDSDEIILGTPVMGIRFATWCFALLHSFERKRAYTLMYLYIVIIYRYIYILILYIYTFCDRDVLCQETDQAATRIQSRFRLLTGTKGFDFELCWLFPAPVRHVIYICHLCPFHFSWSHLRWRLFE